VRTLSPVIVALLLIEQVAASCYVLCAAPGPLGHLRVESIFDTCCHKHDTEASCGSHSPRASGMCRPCSGGCGECGDCVDTLLRHLLAVDASRVAPVVDAPITPSGVIREQAPLPIPPTHCGHDSTGPPTYILTLRILV
jgi:hypothetical protein